MSEQERGRTSQSTKRIIIKARSRGTYLGIMALQSWMISFVVWQMRDGRSDWHGYAWVLEALQYGATIAFVLFGIAGMAAYVGTLMYGSDPNAE